MGLDMYLKKKMYIGGNYDHNRAMGGVKIALYTGTEHEELIEIPANEISEVVMPAGYWRKANQIHNWFVENVQDGKDDCQEYYVSPTELEELMAHCQTILRVAEIHGQQSDATKRVVEDLLPPQSGFFFGSTDIDEYYFKDIKDTVEILSNLGDTNKFDFYYQSSW